MVNKVILIGNVGAEPEIRSLENGVKMARVRIATTEKIYNSATRESKDHTEWHTITFWRGLAEVVERYIHKGSQMYVEGRLRTNEWTDEASGQKRYRTEIQGDEMKMLGRRGDGGGGGYDAPQQGGYGQNQGGYGQQNQPQGGGYGQSAPQGGGYGQSAPQGGGGYGQQQQAPAPQAAPMPADEADDLPF